MLRPPEHLLCGGCHLQHLHPECGLEEAMLRVFVSCHCPGSVLASCKRRVPPILGRGDRAPTPASPLPPSQGWQHLNPSPPSLLPVPNQVLGSL